MIARPGVDLQIEKSLNTLNQKPLIILGSARQQSDTKNCVDFVFKDIQHTILNLLDINISPFNYSANYSLQDDFYKLIETILDYQTIVFATPVYWYSMSGLMKNLFDRFTDIVTVKKKIGRKLSGKSMFLIAVGTDEQLPDGFEIPFRLTAEYLSMIYKYGVYFSTQNDSVENHLQQKNLFIEKLDFYGL